MARIQATISEINQETPTIKSLQLTYDSGDFYFDAGQWVELYLDINDSESVGSYSITSSPEQKGSIQLAIKQGDSHPVTSYLYDSAQVGDKLSFSEAQGEWVFHADEPGTVVMIGAGVGLTPLMSILRTIHQTQPERKVRLIYSVASQEETLFAEELDEIVKQNDNIEIIYTYTRRAPAGWGGHQGRVDHAMLNQLGFRKGDIFFLCGPNEFVDMAAESLDRIGIPVSQLRYEKWW